MLPHYCQTICYLCARCDIDTYKRIIQSSHFRHLQVMMNKFNATPLKIYFSIKPVCVIVNPCVKHEPSECIRIWSHAQRHWSAPKCVNLSFSVKTYIQLNETVLKYMHVSCANTPTNTSSFSFLSFFHSLIKKKKLIGISSSLPLTFSVSLPFFCLCWLLFFLAPTYSYS